MEKKETKRGTYIDEHGGEYSLDGKTLYHYRQLTPDDTLYMLQEVCEVI